MALIQFLLITFPYINLNEENKDEFEILDSKVNNQPIRKSRKRFEHITEDNRKYKEIQQKSLNISDLSDKDNNDEERNSSELNSTINISHTPTRNGNIDDLKNKELLTFNNQSPDEDYEINEKDLDENYNNIYSDEGFTEIENQCQENEQQQAKIYYLRHSQYLSGITEQSIEESILTNSHENPHK